MLLMLTLVSCAGGGNASKDTGGNDASVDEESGGVKMIARITELGERLTVEVLESPYTSGIHWVITSTETTYTARDGKAIERKDLKVRDTVEILYNGQVMMSYPPQIVAVKITVT